MVYAVFRRQLPVSAAWAHSTGALLSCSVLIALQAVYLFSFVLLHCCAVADFFPTWPMRPNPSCTSKECIALQAKHKVGGF